MISVGILDTGGLGHCPSLEFLLPEGERKRLEKERIGKERSLSFFSRILLMKIYEEKMGKKIPEISYTEEGKPYFRNDVCSFSVSHDKNLVVVALSDEGDVGIDVQSFDGNEAAIKRIEKRFLEDIPACEEKTKKANIKFDYFKLGALDKSINLEKRDKNELFFKCEKIQNKDFLLRWTKLEALLKLVGCGFKELNNVNKYLQNVDFETSFLQHGGRCFSLTLAFYKR